MIHTNEEPIYFKQNEMLLEKLRIREQDIQQLGLILIDKERRLNKYKYLKYITVATSIFTAFIIAERLFDFFLSKL